MGVPSLTGVPSDPKPAIGADGIRDKRIFDCQKHTLLAGSYIVSEERIKPIEFTPIVIAVPNNIAPNHLFLFEVITKTVQ